MHANKKGAGHEESTASQEARHACAAFCQSEQRNATFGAQHGQPLDYK